MTRAQAVGALALVVMSLTSLGTSAQQGASSTPKQWLRSDAHRQTSAIGMPSRSGLGKVTAVSLLLAIGGYAVWRKNRKVSSGATPTKTHIRAVGGTLVGPKARAVVAEVGGRLILLGVTEQSVRKLAWLDSADELDTERAPEPNTSRSSLESTPTQSFRSTPKIGAQRRQQSQRSKFSEVLRDAVGIKSRTSSEAADVLAQSTHDHLNLSVDRNQSQDLHSLIDIEGQAAGLVSRLGRSKQ